MPCNVKRLFAGETHSLIRFLFNIVKKEGRKDSGDRKEEVGKGEDVGEDQRDGRDKGEGSMNSS